MQTQNDEIDTGLLAELVELIGIENLDGALQVFARDVVTITQTLATAAGAADADGVRRQAHRMRGLCMQFGAVGMATLAGAIENDKSDQVLQSAALLIERAPAGVEATRAAVGRLAGSV